MNILMVGHSRSGKTSFMAGMYKYLGERKEGYGIELKTLLKKESGKNGCRSVTESIPCGY